MTDEQMMSEIERIARAITDKRAQLFDATRAAARASYLREELATLCDEMRAACVRDDIAQAADLDPTLPSGPHGDEPNVADAIELIQTRWHEDDLALEVEARGGYKWKKLNVPDDAFQAFAGFGYERVSPYVAVPTFTSPGPMTRPDDEAGS